MPTTDHRMTISERTIECQPSWVVKNSNVELAVTQLGAHMAPVTFCRKGGGGIQPYYISPWQCEKMKGLEPVLTPLRGDFFCLPFGGNEAAWRGERHPAHGETCSGRWTLDGVASDGEDVTLSIHLRTKVRLGTVRRDFRLVEGHNAVYCRTRVEGFAGLTPFAHHANLRMPKKPGTLLVSTSPFTFGRTYPVALARPEAGEYQWLARDARFSSLDRVPSLFKGEAPADCSRYPVRAGFCDLLQVFERPRANGKMVPSWVAAANTEENWLWFALKNPLQMPGRLFWIENRGRHGSPWNGRNSCLGVEDGCMYFDRGIAESCRPNPINRRGIPTAFRIRPGHPLEVRYVQGAVATPRGFDRVNKVSFAESEATFVSDSRKKVTVPISISFLLGGGS